MTPAEAHKLLEEATAHLHGNRDTHAKILEALRTIGMALMDCEAQKKIAGVAVKQD